MNCKSSIRVIATVLCVIMLLTAAPMTAFASIENWADNNVVYDGDKFGTNGYYNVISKKDYVLVPGAAVESEIVLNNADGTRRQVMHIIEVDPSNPDVSIVPGYNKIDKDISVSANQSHAKLTDMAKYYEDNLGYNIVGGMNTDLYYDTMHLVYLYTTVRILVLKVRQAPQAQFFTYSRMLKAIFPVTLRHSTELSLTVTLQMELFSML